MPGTYTANKALANANRRIVDFDPGGTDPVVVDLGQPQGAGNKLVPISDGYNRFVAGLFRSVGTGDIDEFSIIAATNAAGTGSPTIVKGHALGSAVDAVGDTIWLEIDVEQIREVLATATHVGVRIEMAADEECVVYFERSEPLHAYDGLTADYIAS